MSRDIYLCWADSSCTDRVHSVQLSSAVGQAVASTAPAWAFSPDSRRLAALLPSGELIIVDLGSGTTSTVTHPGEAATSFRWLGGQEIGYVVRAVEGKQEAIRSFYRQDVGDPDGKRVLVLSHRDVEGAEAQEYWSPHGAYVLFVGGAGVHLLDVSSGSARAFGAAGTLVRAVSWRPDGGRLLCITQEPGPANMLGCLDIETASGAAHDLSTAYRLHLPEVPPALEPLWSADGQFVLANSAAKGAVLIHPEPWRVIWLGEAVQGQLEVDRANRPPWLFRLPLPGWVGLMSDGALYATDCTGSKVVMLLERPAWWAISPDGTRVAVPGEGRTLEVQRIGEWWLRSPVPRSPESVPRSAGGAG